MGRVDDKVAVVTGGATGIGRAVCEVLAREGATVALLDVEDELAQQAVEGIGRDGGTAKFWHADVTSEAEVERTMSEVVQGFGRIDVLVNNAGITGTTKPAHEASEEEFDAVFAVNVKGVWLCTKHTIPYMLGNGGGSIVNFSSIYGLIGNADLPLYHATKGAVRLMSKTDAVVYAKEGIRVNSVHPGTTLTPLVRGLAEQDPDYLEQMNTLHPVGHPGEPEDIAYGVLYLASDESKFVTGSQLVIDGGYTAQ
jgi:NAD(P)-dependent dehydrogenase (short-subunit alcohol dehydrogenase family)